jgi:predicted nucleic acid-binding protein
MTQIAVFDSSALTKRYVPDELGSVRVAEVCESSAVQTMISRLVGIEVAAALTRRVRDGTFTDEDRDVSWTAFMTHSRDEYRVLALDDATCDLAEGIVTSFSVRTLDALHVATAQVLLSELGDDDSLVFYTADRRQAAAAQAAGLEVEYLGD